MFRTPDFVVEGLKLIGGNVIGYNGGGMHIGTNSGIIKLTHNDISTNTSTNNGGGIYVYGGQEVTLTRNSIRNNSCGGFGGGVSITESDKITMTDNTITSNTSNNHGGGIWADGEHDYGPKSDTLTNNVITNNNSNENGGGVFIRGDGTIVTMIDNTIDSNTGVHCGGAAISGGGPAGQVTLINNIISNNVATNTNGGIALSGDNEVNVLDNSIVGNESEDHFGGIAITGSEKIILSNNIIISNNSTNGMCGGFYCDFPGSYENGVITATNNTIVQNTAITNGGGVCIYLDQDGQSAQIYNNIILNNNASERNDIYILNDVDHNFIASPICLFNNDFDQSADGIYIQIPFPIDPSNLNN